MNRYTFHNFDIYPTINVNIDSLMNEFEGWIHYPYDHEWFRVSLHVSPLVIGNFWYQFQKEISVYASVSLNIYTFLIYCTEKQFRL
jgi:hypothetical protein